LEPITLTLSLYVVCTQQPNTACERYYHDGFLVSEHHQACACFQMPDGANGVTVQQAGQLAAAHRMPLLSSWAARSGRRTSTRTA